MTSSAQFDLATLCSSGLVSLSTPSPQGLAFCLRHAPQLSPAAGSAPWSHASPAFHSCQLPQAGHSVVAVTLGSCVKLAASVSMPIGTSRPALGT